MSDPNAWALAVDHDKPAQFSTAFVRRPRMVGLVRRFVSDFHDEIVLGSQANSREGITPWASQLSLAAHELVENAVAYGPDGETMFSITIEPDIDDPSSSYTVRMKTRNRAEPEQREVVRQMLRELNEAEDPFAFYLGLMADSVKRAEGSGLGLARVRVEAEMQVTCVVEGEEIEILAQAKILRDGGTIQ